MATSWIIKIVGVFIVTMATSILIQGRITFEKSTNIDFPGTTYFSTRNISLYECQSWCRIEMDCVAASFSFVVNPLAPVQDTTCILQNKTTSGKPTALPQRSINTYYFTKVDIRSERVCNRLWTFEKVPNTIIPGMDNVILYTANKSSCLEACLNEERFVCRSVEFNHIKLKCHLSEYDRRSPGVVVKMLEQPGVEYFENFCLRPEETCNREGRSYSFLQVDLPQSSLARFVGLYYYSDKELLVHNKENCLLMCSSEKEFICRSVLYSPNVRKGHSNCALYHIDHVMFPDGKDTYFVPSPIPLLDLWDRSGIYLETACTISSGTQEFEENRIPTFRIPPSGGTGSQKTSNSQVAASSSGDPSCDDYGFCYDVSIQCTDVKMVVFVRTNKPFHGQIYALGRSETCRANVHNDQQFQLDVSLKDQDCNTESAAGAFTNTVVLQHHSFVMTKSDKVYNIRCTYETTSKNVSFGMMPVGDMDMTHLADAPEAPAPSIHILMQSGREATTVRIGDKLTFRIEIPATSPYGIFARSCVAMAKDGRSVFTIIDKDGCPVDSSIFPRFIQAGQGLESNYEAFRFTESYGVIFQCNVKYCIGKCDAISCGEQREIYPSWGRRKREVKPDKISEETIVNHEIFVLDYGDKEPKFSSDALNSFYDIQESMPVVDCSSQKSVMVLSIISAILVVIYICTVTYFVSQRRVQKGFS